MARTRKQPAPISMPRPQEKPKGVWEKQFSLDEDRQSYEMNLGSFRLWVSNGHIDYRGEWVMRGEPFVSLRPLRVSTADEAKKKALEMVRSEIDPIHKLLREAE